MAIFVASTDTHTHSANLVRYNALHVFIYHVNKIYVPFVAVNRKISGFMKVPYQYQFIAHIWARQRKCQPTSEMMALQENKKKRLALLPFYQHNGNITFIFRHIAYVYEIFRFFFSYSCKYHMQQSSNNSKNNNKKCNMYITNLLFILMEMDALNTHTLNHS